LQGKLGMANKTLHQIQADATRRAIAKALDKYDGNRTLAAESLGISRSQFYRYMVELGLIKKASSAGGGARQPIRARN